MKLSDAIALGQGTVGKWESGNLAHCALGMACNSVGIPQHFDELADEYGDYEVILQHWPWLRQQIPLPYRKHDDGSPIIGEAMQVIYDTFDSEVMSGQVSFEKFLDWVRSIEPQEPAEQPTPAAEKAEEVGVETKPLVTSVL
jgi:hypothetical protein